MSRATSSWLRIVGKLKALFGQRVSATLQALLSVWMKEERRVDLSRSVQSGSDYWRFRKEVSQAKQNR